MTRVDGAGTISAKQEANRPEPAMSEDRDAVDAYLRAEGAARGGTCFAWSDAEHPDRVVALPPVDEWAAGRVGVAVLKPREGLHARPLRMPGLRDLGLLAMRVGSRADVERFLELLAMPVFEDPPPVWGDAAEDAQAQSAQPGQRA
ncbi:MAG: hypothetical protein KGN16_20090 [Burkholderiales bacterium]|nr:hypothetical protein [Burkholderiales bacterium]